MFQIIKSHYLPDIFDAFCILLLRIASFALICADISRSNFLSDSVVGLLDTGTFTTLALPPLFSISLVNILIILKTITSQSYGRFSQIPDITFQGVQYNSNTFIYSSMEKPEVLILDEPMNSLDKKSVELVRGLLDKHVNEGGTLLLTSHNKADIERLCQKVYEFDDGKLILQN